MKWDKLRTICGLQIGRRKEEQFSDSGITKSHEFIQSKMPSFFRPTVGCQNVRLGLDCDGGYIVDGQSVDKADFLLSFGINDDWSFERDFLKRNKVEVVAFDGSIGVHWFLKRWVKHPRETLLHGAKFFDYLRFLSGRSRHVPLFVGAKQSKSHIAFAEIVTNYLPKQFQSVFLKIDIEGDEYIILDDIVAIGPRISGLVIEFHDIPKHLQVIEEFIAKLPLSLCHVHANNNANLLDGGISEVVEITFTRFGTELDNLAFVPNSLDRPNNKSFPEIQIVF